MAAAQCSSPAGSHYLCLLRVGTCPYSIFRLSHYCMPSFLRLLTRKVGISKMNKNYTTYGHSKTNLKYHVIFSTKYRRKCLSAIREHVLAAFRYSEKISDFQILTMEIDKDHIHFLLTFKPSLSIEQVIKRMKQISTSYLYDQCSKYLGLFYYGDKNIIWTRGYFCSTIGAVSEETARQHIENQG